MFVLLSHMNGFGSLFLIIMGIYIFRGRERVRVRGIIPIFVVIYMRVVLYIEGYLGVYKY